MNLFDGSRDDAALWRALHDPEFRALLTPKGLENFPLPALPEAEDFLTRLAYEAETLWEKMAKLKTFIDSRDFVKLTSDAQGDLRRQYDAMDRYHEILACRLDKLTPTNRDSGAIDAGDEALGVRVTGSGSDETPIPFT